MRVAHDTLVPAAVKEQRRAFAVADVLDLPEEQRVVAAPVAPHNPGHELRERALDERRVADDLEAGISIVGARPAREPVGERRLPLLQHAHPEVPALPEQRVQPRPPVDRDQHERRPQRHRHERVGRHAVHLLAHPRRDHRHPGREHPERPAELDRRVGIRAGRGLHLLGRRRNVEERLPDPLGRARDREPLHR